MKKIFDDQDDDFNRGLTKEEKIQILVKVVPIVLIVIILLITLLIKSVSNNRNQVNNSESGDSAVIGVIDGETKEESNTIFTPLPSAVQEESESTAVPTAEPTAFPTASPYTEIMEKGNVDYSKVAFNTEEQLKEMQTYWKAGNQKALDDLANLDRFIAMSYQLRGTKEFFYYGDKNSNGLPEGKGIAVYADNQYYYGDWKNGVREGEGFWRHYHIHPTGKSNDIITYHQYSGEFKNDLPDGEGSEHYDFKTELLKEGTGYNSNLIGTYQKGLLNGSFYITNVYADNNMKEWNATAKNGSFTYLAQNRDKEGRGPVMVDTKDENNYIWMSEKENRNLGVMCYISDKK